MDRVPTASALAKARKRAGLTQQALAARLGIDVSTLAKYELGARTISVKRLLECSKLLQEPSLMSFVSADTLLDAGTHQMPDSASAAKRFDTVAFGRWWAKHSSEVYAKFPIPPSELDRFKLTLHEWVLMSLRTSSVGPDGVSDQTLEEIATEFLPALKGAIRRAFPPENEVAA